MPERGTIEWRFWGKVLIGGPDDCWAWTGKKCNWGYGSLWAGGGKQIGSHRLSYLLHKGDIPDGMIVQHDCDNPSCVNPKHLTLGTHKTNSDDKIAKGRCKPNSPRGERCGLAKLTERQVRAIRSEAGTLASVAAKYGVSPGAIHYIRIGRTWGHVS